MITEEESVIFKDAIIKSGRHIVHITVDDFIRTFPRSALFSRYAFMVERGLTSIDDTNSRDGISSIAYTGISNTMYDLISRLECVTEFDEAMEIVMEMVTEGMEITKYIPSENQELISADDYQKEILESVRIIFKDVVEKWLNHGKESVLS
jgi:hypothetical protein